MLRIIFLSAVRSLARYKNLTFINLLGLVAGLTSFLFITQYVVYEFSFDSFITKQENVYRVNWEVTKQGESIYKGAKSPRGLCYAVREDIPEVEANAVAYFEKCQVLYEDTYYANQDILWVSEDFEKVFPLKMIKGIAVYDRPRVGIISETSSKALFHETDPVGKIMVVNGEMNIEITGVFKDLPSNTHLTAQYFVSSDTWIEMGAIKKIDWRSGGWWNYIRLKNGVSPEQVLSKINGFNKRYMGFLTDDNRESTFTLQPLKDLHYLKGIEGEMGATTNHSSLVNLIIIALFTLFIAWINYVNLSIAHAQTRSLQISMRKLVGASNMHIWHQSLAECIILNMVALTISFTLFLIFKNSFANLFNIPLRQANISSGYIIIILFTIVTAGILFSSIYYGIDLARINYLAVQNKLNSGRFKQGLVMVQMALSVIFLISTIVVYKQISYMKNKPLGMELNGVLLCTGPASLNPDPHKREKYQGFKNEVLTNAGFESVTFNMFVPGMEPPGLVHYEYRNPSTGIVPGVIFYENNADDGLINTYKYKLLAGKEFEKSQAQNWNHIIINETSLRVLGFKSPEDAIGKWIFRRGNDSIRYTIVGVVADFHNEGMQKPIYPIIWSNSYPWVFGYFAIRVNSKNIRENIARLQRIWDKHYPKDKFDFVFADQQFNNQYESESRYSRFYVWLTFLSITIASIGLYGLIIFYLEKRKREISLRKVNGASVGQVLVMLNRDFLRWVIVSYVFACPIAWIAMHKWLESFAYKTILSWWIFIGAGVAVLGIAFLTVSWQSWRAASRNPVEVLRYE